MYSRTVASAALLGACSLAFMSSAQAAPLDPLIFDNGVVPNTGLSSQLDTVYPFESQVADDFVLAGGGQFNVTGISFTGLQFNDPPDIPIPTDFNIFFYADGGGAPLYTGDGTSSPVADAIASITATLTPPEPVPGPYTYAFDFVADAGQSAVVLNAGTTYWVTVQADFPFPPQFGWEGDSSGGNAVQGFPLLGTPFWSPVNTEMVFQLYGTRVTGVPTPTTAMLMVAGLIGLALRRRRS